MSIKTMKDLTKIIIQ